MVEKQQEDDYAGNWMYNYACFITLLYSHTSSSNRLQDEFIRSEDLYLVLHEYGEI